MRTGKFPLASDHVAQCDLLKLAGLADSGGQGKALVAAGEASVDGRLEGHESAKIPAAGQVVEGRAVRIWVRAS
jgi:ribosome-associated protein